MYLGIDIGTSGVKAVVVGDDGGVLDQASAPLSVSRPQALWSEQDPESWWTATGDAVCALDARLRGGVKAIGIAGQMHGATLLDRDSRPLRPAILWNDGRSFAECAEIEALVPGLASITGNLAMPGFTAPKLLWLRTHEPETFSRVDKILLPKDFVRLRMTGVMATDMSDSAGTLWLDVGRRQWSAEMLAACGLNVGQMPALHEGVEVTGELRPEVAADWGTRRVPVMAGGGDNAAGAAGVGVVHDGDALLSLGTSGVIFVATDSFRPNPAGAVHAFCHCLPRMWHLMAVHLNAASCVDWATRLLGVKAPAELFERAEAVGPGGGPELFLPYLSGERTPHNDPKVRGAFLNLDNDTDPARLAQAVLEGVAFALGDGLSALRNAGTKVDTLSVVGGGARSRYWGRIIASALDVPLTYLDGGEVGPALGAARLARAGLEPAHWDEIFSSPPISLVIEPEASVRDRLSEKRQRFQAAYEHISHKDVLA